MNLGTTVAGSVALWATENRKAADSSMRTSIGFISLLFLNIFHCLDPTVVLCEAIHLSSYFSYQ